jgi:hypothetical protein
MTLIFIFKKCTITAINHTLFISFSFRRISFTAEKQFILCFINSSDNSGDSAVRSHLACSRCHISQSTYSHITRENYVTYITAYCGVENYSSFINGGAQFRTSAVFTIVHIVTDLLRALLSNGSVSKPQQRLFSMGSASRPW